MSRVLRFLVVSLFVLLSAGCLGRFATVTVVDQNGEPVSDAEVSMGFLGFPGWGHGTEATNSSGKVTQWGDDSLGIKTSVSKSGYYRTERRLGTQDSFFLNETLVLREKINPHSMYVRRVSLLFHEQGRTKGFDMKEGDWVEPHGEGKNAHIFFTFWGEKRGLSDKEGVIEIDFPGNEGGIKNSPYPAAYLFSDYKFPYNAPESGYKNTIRHNILRRPDHTYRSTLDTNRSGYIFKLVLGQDGKKGDRDVYYGKVFEEFAFSPLLDHDTGAEGFVSFAYYLNADKEYTGLEYNKDNLFPDNNSYRVTFPY